MIRKNSLQEALKKNWISLVPYVVLLVLTVIMAVINPRTLSMRFIANKCDAAFSLVLVSIGQTLVLLSGGFDLSVGGVICVTNSLLAVNMGGGPGSIFLWCVICAALGTVIGLFNGFVIAKAQMQPFIVTLATQSVCYGAALLILKVDGGNIDPRFIGLLISRIFGVPLSLILTALLILLWLYVKRTGFGLALYAVGSNEKAAHLNSINVFRTKLLAYGLSGLFAALVGIYRTAHVASGSPTAGASFVITSIVAAVLGGTAISGGVGGIAGTVAGAFILRAITDLLVFLKVSAYWTSLVQGALLVAAVALTSYAKLRRTSEVAQ
ncbi:MAG: ABC transporter permease [Treponema sp.]|nr:ABC transporter permease [Treponema sp.]